MSTESVQGHGAVSVETLTRVLCHSQNRQMYEDICSMVRSIVELNTLGQCQKVAVEVVFRARLTE